MVLILDKETIKQENKDFRYSNYNRREDYKRQFLSVNLAFLS